VSFNVGVLKSAHAKFLTAHSDMVSGVLYDAGVVALSEVAVHPGFKPRTGKLQGAAKTRLIRARNGKVLRITDDRPYARSIEEGSRPHKIVARNGKFLRFVNKSGALVFRRSVNHPGNRPYWFLRNAQHVAGSAAQRMLLAGMQRLSRTHWR
jgi:hypothetical protein